MMNQEKLINKIKGIQSDLKKKLYFIAYITDLLNKQRKSSPIIIGGLALSYYSREVYSTADIDLAYSDSESMNKILTDLKFKKEGRYWINDEMDIAVEIPVSVLTGENSPLERVEIEDKLVCNIIGLEDLIIDRMNACKHWKSRIDCEMVELLLVKYKGSVNWEYLEEKSRLPVNNTQNELSTIKKKLYENK